jgi:hypothetical protein
MKIKTTKQNNKFIFEIEIDATQKSYDAVDECIGDTDNLIGVINGYEYTISQLIDLGYKGDQQEGSPIIHCDTKEQLREICKQLDLQIWEYPICAYCNNPIRESYTLGDKGNMCFSCQLENEKGKE